MSTSIASDIASKKFVPEERSFTMRNGIVIAAKYWRHGAGQSRDCRRLLTFHGFLDNACSFDLLIPLLLKQLGPEPVEILALDLAGHGLSSHRQTEDYALWRYLEDADQVAEQMGWSKHAVMGHSMGGAVASLYAGLWPERTTLCILLDNFGPWTRAVEEQPNHLLEHIAEKKALATKRLPFHPSIEAAVRARTNGGNWQIQEAYAAIFTPRSLMPVERTDEQGNVQHGYTWRSDRVLTIRSATTVSDEYSKAFMSRITCPFMAVLATNGFLTLAGVVEERTTWMPNAAVVTVCSVEGYHHVHLEDAPLVAGKVSEWILAQDKPEKARL